MAEYEIRNAQGQVIREIIVTERRDVDPETGGRKGRKPEDFSLVSPAFLAELARVLDYGARKYEPHNWRRGYPYSWSYAALQRHLNAFWEGEDNDSESGLSHLAHAAAHVMFLLEFIEFGVGKDDRYRFFQP